MLSLIFLSLSSFSLSLSLFSLLSTLFSLLSSLLSLLSSLFSLLSSLFSPSFSLSLYSLLSTLYSLLSTLYSLLSSLFSLSLSFSPRSIETGDVTRILGNELASKNKVDPNMWLGRSEEARCHLARNTSSQPAGLRVFSAAICCADPTLCFQNVHLRYMVVIEC